MVGLAESGAHMLKSFSVQGYRTFEKKVTLDLANTRDYKFNEHNVHGGIVNTGLIVGRNASGKSNLGRAIADVTDVYRVRESDGSLSEDPLYLNADCDSSVASFEYVFQLGGTEIAYAYDRGSDGSFHRELLLFDGNVVFEYDNDRSSLIDGDLSLVGAEALNWRFEDDFVSLLSYISNSVPAEKLGVLESLRSFVRNMYLLDPNLRDRSFVEAYCRHIVSLGRVAEFEEFLRYFGIEEHLQEVANPDGRKSIYCRRSHRLIPFGASCSSGTRMLLSLFGGYVLRPRKSFVYLDEFDAYCHFEMAEKIVRFFGDSSGCQTICTTHNTSLVQNDVMRPDCVFLLSTNQTLAALSERTSRELRYGHNIEKLLRNGEFA